MYKTKILSLAMMSVLIGSVAQGYASTKPNSSVINDINFTQNKSLNRSKVSENLNWNLMLSFS